MAAPGAFHARGFHPTAICGIFGGVAAAARLGGLDAGGDDERARDRRLVRLRPVRLPRRRDADEADAPRLGGARRAPRHAAGRARRRRARLGARGQVRPLPRVRRRGGGRDRHRRAARRPRQAVGDAADRVQAVPGVPLHARLARRRGARAPRDERSRPTRSRTCSSTVPEAGVSLVLEPAAREAAPALRVRGQVLAPVLDRVAARPRARRRRRTSPTRRSPTRRCSRSRAKVRYETREYPTYPQAFPGGAVVGSPTGRRSRRTTRTRRAGPRTRSRPTRCARSSARTPRSRSRTRPSSALEEAVLALEEQDDVRGRARAARVTEAVPA